MRRLRGTLLAPRHLGDPRAILLLLLAFLPWLLAATADARSAPPGEGLLVVADLRGHELVLIPGSPGAPDMTRARRIALPGGPHELLALPDGRIVVSLEQFGRLAVVDLGGETVEAIEIGGVPHGLALRRGELLVTDRSDGAVRVFRIDGWVEEPPLDLGSDAAEAWPHAVGVRPDGALVVALAGTDALWIDGRPAATADLPETLALMPDGGVVTATALGGTVEWFAPDGRPVASVVVGGRPVRVAVAPDGRQVAAALSAASAVAVIEAGAGTGTGTGAGTRLVPVAGVPDGLAFDASGRWLYVSDLAGGALTIIDMTGEAGVRTLPAVAASMGSLLYLDP